MNVTFLCPNCECPSRTALSGPAEWQCDVCGHCIPLNVETSEKRISKCVVCGNKELYKKKDFPHRLGLTILVVACIASFITYLWYEIWYTWAILLGTAVFDGLLYWMVGDAIVCYRCNAHYRGIARGSEHEPHEIVIGERYRQERIRREQLKAEERSPAK